MRRYAAGIRLSWATLLSAYLLSGCLFEVRDPDANGVGYASLELRLKPSANALLKRATNTDTLFRLDSLVIRLSTSGESTLVNRYPISGRADTGNIVIPAKTFALAPLRTWKAVIYTIDTTASPARVDTVHRDSVTFIVKPGDTTFISKTVNPVYAILRARLVSNSPASLTNPVKYVRIRVDGVTRDSMPVGPALRSVDIPSTTTGILVGDSGTILRTTNGGLNWTAATSGTTANLYGVNMPGTNAGFAVGAGGVVVKTTTGTSWSTVTSGTSANLYATYWTSTTNGWALGAGGVILKTNGTTFTPQTSGTTQDLNAAYFSSANNGNAAGNNGVILRTTNGGTNWTAQTSGTTQKLNAMHFPAAATGFVVGNGGVILKTTNSGTNWTALTSGTTADLTGIYMTSTTTGTAVGKGGVILTTADGTSWTLRSSGTASDFYCVGWTSNNSSAVAIGAYSAVSFTTTNTSFAFQPFGTKSFDVLLAYKYFTPNTSHTLLMDAIDTLAGALRGYEATKTVLLSPGKDTTITPNSSLSKCGYSGLPACTP
ncbi:MAG: hypothetical protein JF616_17940 [Fibrobacteres bacterium]|nr:hypothetical protein [Fibrobacterota bacterium]